ncbi:condensation domain protein [Mycobacterium xenopi 3993]|nr:condensation domain protein [Mycobacterium xenopi 3993]
MPATGTSFTRWASLLSRYARRPDVVATAEVWRQVAATPAALPAVRPETDTFAAAGYLSASLDAHDTRMLLGEVPAAFHAGVHDILLIGFALAVAQLGPLAAPRSASTSRATAATRTLPRRRPVAHGGVVHHQVPGVVDGRPVALGAGSDRRTRAGSGDQAR